MSNVNLKTYLISNVGVDEHEILSIIENSNTKTFKKGQFLLRKNEHCKHTFFVEKRHLRQYSMDKKGKEDILSFAPENWFVTDRESSYFNQSSVYYIQALEDSQVVVLDERFIHQLSWGSERVKKQQS